MRKWIHDSARALATLVVCLLAGTGCAPYQMVGVSSNPPGAQVYLDGELVGVTPRQLRIDRLDHHKVFLKKEGYRPELFVLELRPAEDGIDYLTPPDIGVRMLASEGDDGDKGLEIELEPDPE